MMSLVRWRFFLSSLSLSLARSKKRCNSHQYKLEWIKLTKVIISNPKILSPNIENVSPLFDSWKWEYNDFNACELDWFGFSSSQRLDKFKLIGCLRFLLSVKNCQCVCICAFGRICQLLFRFYFLFFGKWLTGWVATSLINGIVNSQRQPTAK